MRLAPMWCLVMTSLMACGGRPTDTLVVRADLALQGPLQVVADSFGISLRLGTLHDAADVIALDDASMKALAVPYWRVAADRIVLAYRPGAPGSDSITGDNWWRIVQLSHAPQDTTDAAVAHAVGLVLQLAERYYHRPGLAMTLRRSMGTGTSDYWWTSEWMARRRGWGYVRLPEAIDLGTAADSAAYGAPALLYGVTRPANAPHADRAAAYLRYLMSADGRRVLHQANITPLDPPMFVALPAA
jgi:ABC-type molybdate transport system substrate-binding protein